MTKTAFFPFRGHLKGSSLLFQSPSLCPGDSRQVSLEIAAFETIKTPRGITANSEHPCVSARAESGSSLLQALKQSPSPAFPAAGTRSLCSFALHTVRLAGKEIQNGICLDYHSTSFTSGEGEGILPWVHPMTQS